MKLSNWLALGVLLGAFAAALPAQRMVLGDGSGREVVVLDVVDLLGPAAAAEAAGGPARALGLARKGKAEPIPASDLERLASLARIAGGAGNARGDVQALGGRHLVAMGEAKWIGLVESFLRDARANTGVQFLLDMKVVELDADTYGKIVPRGEAGAADGGEAEPAMVVLDGEAADKLLKEAVSANVLQAPQIVAQNLQVASISVEEQIAYVRDFTVRTVNGTVIAEPVVDIIEAGTRIESLCAVDKDGKVLVDVSFRHQVVDQPLAEWKTEIAVKGQELTVQVPRVSGCKASMKLLMAPGSTALVSSKRSDGKWLLLMARVQRVDQEAKGR